MKILVFLFISQIVYSQQSIEEVINKYNTKAIPYIQITEFKKLKRPIILDTREYNEYETSHIKNAVYVGFKDFKIENIQKKYPNKNDTIVVYCSLSVRSEKIGLQIKQIGYTCVYNLYGGVFNWINNNELVYNNENIATKKIHAYSKTWGKYLIKGEKIY